MVVHEREGKSNSVPSGKRSFYSSHEAMALHLRIALLLLFSISVCCGESERALLGMLMLSVSGGIWREEVEWTEGVL